ncbi:tetratricopeptide repeat protein [Sphingomonas sp.]|uniref:tetratricopeptide repeat protein n=2 Tax=unclassified Sphingomonas TaxID=196159 RepID=UPI0035A97FF1
MAKNFPMVKGQWVLAGAAVALILAIGYSASSSDSAAPPPAIAAKSKAIANQPQAIETLRARAEASPGDSSGWAALGDALFAKGEFSQAAEALQKGTSADPKRADLWSALGEARVMASPRDPMPPEALASFRKALLLDPKDPRSRYFTAVARDLGGDHQGAIDDWMALLKDTPPGASWENDLRRTITQVAKINKIDVANKLAALKPSVDHPAMPAGPVGLAGIPGPSAAQMQAAAALTPSQQDAMAQQMVTQLEGKLRTNPSNIDGWVMLMRSRKTLGENAKASKALADAVTANPAAAARLKSEAAALGIASL